MVNSCIQTQINIPDNGIYYLIPGWKFNHWELKGVPVRMEIGPRDIKSNSVVVVRRDNGAKATLPLEGIEDSINKLLDSIHDDMYAKALAERDANLVRGL